MTTADQQQTLHRAISCEGVALHSGRATRLTLAPAPADAGITFHRTDLSRCSMPATISALSSTTLATSLKNGKGGVATVEHLLSALYGSGIDNLTVKVDGPEVPILDGSAVPFLDLIDQAGVRRQSAPRRPIRITAPIEARDGESWIRAEPGAGFQVDYRVDYAHPAIRQQALALQIDPARYAADIAPARTFGFLHEVQALRDRGLVQGGSMDNAIVLDEEKVVNGDLRFADEFVRHKILDLVGDLALLGAPLQGTVTVYKGSHRLHTALVRTLLEQTGSWDREAVVEPVAAAAPLLPATASLTA